MKISLNWLKRYIALKESVDVIAETLTNTGLEVESTETFDPMPGGLQGLVIGEVLTCEKHPNADKLQITTVDVGLDHHPTIVCGAQNVAVGQKVVVALPGVTIHPTSGEPFKIKLAKIRGEQSAGMICAEDEIGLGSNHDGIMVLDTNVANGTPASEYFNIISDTVFEIGLTPNRADAASHIGVARDLKAALNRNIQWPDVTEFSVQDNSFPIKVTVENTAACPRYTGLTISNVKVAPSPDWLQQLLLAIGIAPINNIVDITNFVLHETGQPLHAFDANKITGHHVVVKTLPEGTPFKTLDDKARALKATDLMICDEQKGMCIAGVFGGIDSGITNHTQHVFLESACFSPDYIRKTSQYHQLQTDASFRFERGTDPELTVYALKRTALLIKEIAGGNIASELIDVYPKKIEPVQITCTWKYIQTLIGQYIPNKRVTQILRSLDFQILASDKELFIVEAPTYRIDVKQPADVAEEILRIYGFNNIDLEPFVGSNFLAAFPEKDINKYKRTLGDQLASNGFLEIMTNSLSDVHYKKYLNKTDPPIEILNRLSEEQGMLRQTLLLSGLEVCAYNINRKQKDLQLFEFGKVYHHREQYKETEQIALFMTGLSQPESWRNQTKQIDFYDLKQHVAQLLSKCGIESWNIEKTEHPTLDQAVMLQSLNNNIGLIGKVKQSILHDFGIKQDIFYAELDIHLLFQQSTPMLGVREVSKFPEVRRDLSLVLDKKVSFSDILKLAQETESRLIKDITAFDVYEGNKIPEGKKAYALGFILSDHNKTLTDSEIDRVMNKLMRAFEKKMEALIRK